MPRLEQTIDAVFSDRDITPSDVPQLDLYMDQVLTLFDRTLSESKRTPEDKLLTKTMVNNYVKEGLITPVRGKKYTRDQIMQLLRLPSQADAPFKRRQGADRQGGRGFRKLLRFAPRRKGADARVYPRAAALEGHGRRIRPERPSASVPRAQRNRKLPAPSVRKHGRCDTPGRKRRMKSDVVRKSP